MGSTAGDGVIAVKFMEETFTVGKVGHCKNLQRNDNRYPGAPQQGKDSRVPGSLDPCYRLN